MENQTIPILIQDEGHENVSISAFIKTLSCFRDLAEEVDRTMNGAKTTTWRIADLRRGSAHAIIEAVPKVRRERQKTERLVGHIRSGLQALPTRDLRAAPAFFSEKALSLARKLAAIPGKKVTLKIGDVEITSQILANVDEIQRVDHSCMGTMEGSIDAVWLHKSNRFTLFLKDDSRVECHFQPEFRDKLGGFLGKTVCVTGRIRYRRDGTPISVAVEDVTEIRQPEGDFKIGDFVGIWKLPCPSTEYVRRIRDA